MKENCYKCLHVGVCILYKEVEALSSRLCGEVKEGKHKKTFNIPQYYNYKGFRAAVVGCPLYAENPSAGVSEWVSIEVAK